MKRWKREFSLNTHRKMDGSLIQIPSMHIRATHLAWGFKEWKVERFVLGFYLLLYEVKGADIHETLIRDEINTLKGIDEHGRFE